MNVVRAVQHEQKSYNFLILLLMLKRPYCSDNAHCTKCALHSLILLKARDNKALIKP